MVKTRIVLGFLLLQAGWQGQLGNSAGYQFTGNRGQKFLKGLKDGSVGRAFVIQV